MSFEITFSDGKSRKYTDDVEFAIGDTGALTITGGGDVWIYAPHAWSVIKTQESTNELW